MVKMNKKNKKCLYVYLEVLKLLNNLLFENLIPILLIMFHKTHNLNLFFFENIKSIIFIVFQKIYNINFIFLK